MRIRLACLFFMTFGTSFGYYEKCAPPKFAILALYENGGHHVAFSKRAKLWLDSLAVAEHFEVNYIQSSETIDEEFLDKYALVFQLDFVPYGWAAKAMTAFESYVREGRGGWIGLHHASLLGEFDGFKMWPWFSGFMGGIRYKNYISTFVSANVKNENDSHPVMQGCPSIFKIEEEEWYIYDKSPRGKVDVLASVDEDSYLPDSDIKMGDHPVIWSNPDVKARNVYIFMGHSPKLFDNVAYKTLLSNAIFWGAGRK